MLKMELPIYISFIVPVYNVSAFLDDCVQSLCRIQNPGIEILLVDDGSTDGCEAICRKYAEMDRRVHVYTQENRGVSASRNNGLMQAAGKWICFVDGDDCLSDAFESLIMPQIDESAEVIYFGYQRMQDGRRPECDKRGSFLLAEKDLQDVRKRTLNKDACRDASRFPGTIMFDSACGKLVRKEKILEWKVLFDESISWGEDLIFHFKLLQHVRQAQVIDCTGYYYRINALSVTQKYDTRAEERFHLLVNAMGIEVKQSGSTEIMRQYQVFVLKQLLQSVQRDVLNPSNPKPYRERREDYRKLRHSEVVTRALSAFPYGSVRIIYKVAIRIVACGSYGLLWLFYQLKRLIS